MAIIYNYPQKTTPAGGDFLVITDSEQPAPNKNRTKSLTVDNLANYVVTSTSGITGSGTLNTIAMFTPDGQSIGDSFITQTVSPDAVNVSTRFNVSPEGVNAFNVSQVGGTTGVVSIPGILKVNGTYYDAAGDEGTDGDVLVAKGTPGNMATRWVSKAGTGIATGSGTTNTLPIWTDGPNGVLGDSIITYDDTSIPIITIGPQPSRLVVDGDLTVNNRAVFAGPYTRFNGLIEDGTGSAGTTGQVLTSTATGVAWDDATDIVSGAVAKLIPFNVTASPGGSSVYNADNNIVEISWTTGNGIYVLILPTATGSNAYRNIRFVTNGTFPGGASHKVEITALPGETVDGAAFFEISKTYEGVSLWSNGTEWIVIQAKAH
jgi:hypothetical protein